MVKLIVEEGKIRTQMAQENKGYPLYEEVGNGIVELLVQFRLGLLKYGNSMEATNAAYQEMVSTIIEEAEKRFEKSLNPNSTIADMTM